MLKAGAASGIANYEEEGDKEINDGKEIRSIVKNRNQTSSGEMLNKLNA